MLNRILETSGNEIVCNTTPTSVRCMHPWSHGTHPGGSLILAAIRSANLVWWSPQKVHQVKTIRLHFQSLSNTLPLHGHSRHLHFTTHGSQISSGCEEKTVSVVPLFLLTHVDVLHSSLYKGAPFVWNCWYQCLMLLADWGSLWNCRRKARWTETTDSCFANCSARNAFCSGVAIFSLEYHG
jgi:hypothetical protein